MAFVRLILIYVLLISCEAITNETKKAAVPATWAAQLTESPVAAVTLNGTILPTPSSSVVDSPSVQIDRTSVSTGLPSTDVPSAKDGRQKLKKIDLITRRPSDKRRKLKARLPTSTEVVQNDSPHQESQMTWAHLPDKHTQTGEEVTDSIFAVPKSFLSFLQNYSPKEPDFKKARSELGRYWIVHKLSAGGLFMALTLINMWQLISKMFSPCSLVIGKARFVCLMFLMITGTSLRAIYLLVDPYNVEKSYSSESIHVIMDLPLLCIAAVYTVIIISLLDITGVRSKCPKNCTIIFVVTLISSIALSCDIFSGIYKELEALRLVPLVLFICWTTVMAVSYMFVVKDMQRKARIKHGENLRATFTKLHIEGADLPNSLPRPTICVAVRITLINAILLLALNGGILYGIVAIFGVFRTKRQSVDPWPWWSQQLILRMLEGTICILMVYSASQRQVSCDDGASSDQDAQPSSLCCLLRCCRRKDIVHNYESCSDIAYGFRNENFNTSLDFSNVPTATHRSQAWSRGQTTAPRTFQGRSDENSAKSYCRNSLLSHPIQALSSLGSGKQSRFATNSSVESSQRHSTILFREKLRRSAVPPAESSHQVTSVEEDEMDNESIRARMGSRPHSITEEDAMLLSSPFFPRFKRSHCSSLDNSIDVSSDQLSSLGQSGVEFVPHHHRRTTAESTCSSESAANSFDVAFFLNSNPKLDHTQAVAAQREFMERLVRHEQERHIKRSSQEERKRFLEEYDRLQDAMRRERTSAPEPRSISPIVSARSKLLHSTRLASMQGGEMDNVVHETVHQPNHQPPSVHKMSLDLAPSGVVGAHPAHTRAIGQGTIAADEDITPDSAVYLDLHMSPVDDNSDLHIIHNSFHSLKRASRSFLNRINSTFSLSNKSYAPLESADECVTYFGADTLDKTHRLRSAKSADALASSEHDRLYNLQHGDSGLLVEENSQRSSVLCDSACQTEPLCT